MHTVFFLGAGASAGFGFPCGSLLIEQICDDLRKETPLLKYLRDVIRVPQQELVGFAHMFIAAKRTTLDEFLYSRTDLIELGRLIIGAKLIMYEDSARLSAVKDDWLTIYLNHLLEDCHNYNMADDALDAVEFYTLNYDRTVEHLIFTLLKARYGNTCPDDRYIISDAEKRVRHLHGLLGGFSLKSSLNKRQFSNELQTSADEFKEICSSLKFWSEMNNKANGYDILNEQIANADCVVFLGFGFHESILGRFSDNVFSGKKIFCSAFQITQKQWNKILVRLGGGLPIYGDIPLNTKRVSNTTFGTNKQTSGEFMKEIVGFL